MLKNADKAKPRKKAKIVIIALEIVLILVIAAVIVVFIGRNRKYYAPDLTAAQPIEITSPAFADGGQIPIEHTGFGQDISPELDLATISDEAVSIAIIMDDLSHPLVKDYNHWVIWNIPAGNIIPKNIAYGEKVEELGGAVQGVGYGRNRYRGPKPPSFMKEPHTYIFNVYVLDCALELEPSAQKNDLLKAMDGHVLQYGSITGYWKNE